MEEITGDKLMAQLAQGAYCLAKDKEQVEKSTEVDNATFEKCMVNMPEHHKNFNRKRGFLRTYHEPFWTENKEGMGRTYHHGVVHIVDKDSKVNQTYEISTNAYNFAREINYRVGELRHRVIEVKPVYGNGGVNINVILTPQRWNLNGD